mmetsp:Transcript_49447/g.117646  ORF Transcript_49447/g.117646 Transcript_49447/m.117646 type:complete len:389 (+) Transcript_49447:74-1240(+)
MADEKVHHSDTAVAVASAATMRAAVFSGTLLVSVIVIRSLQAILLEECAVDHRYPFVFQTLLLFPFFMQTCLTFAFIVCEAGLEGGVALVVTSAKHTLPVAFFAALLAVNVVLQGWSLLYISSSAYAVVLQLLVVFVALAERLVLQRRMSLTLWALVLLQSGAVMSYQMSVNQSQSKPSLTHHSSKGFEGHTSSSSDQVLGLGLCVMGMLCCSVGSIVQQRFFQHTEDVKMPMSVKFFYQFLYGLLSIVFYTLCRRDAMVSIVHKGFFHGWTSTTLAVGCLMWGAYQVSTMICAYLSALAGAMAVALVVITVGAFNALVRGVPTTSLQIILMLVVSANSALFAYMRQISVPRSAEVKSDTHIVSMRDIEGNFGTFSRASSLRMPKHPS